MKYLSIQETAERLGICMNSAYRWTRSGVIPSAKFGSAIRVSEADIEKFYEQNRRAK